MLIPKKIFLGHLSIRNERATFIKSALLVYLSVSVLYWYHLDITKYFSKLWAYCSRIHSNL